MAAIPWDRRFRLLFKPLHTPERYYANYERVRRLDLGRMSIYAQLKAAVAFAQGDLLDFGCGMGYVTHFLGARGVDVEAAAIALARKNFPGTDYECRDLESLLQEGRRYRALTCVNVLEHFEDEFREHFLTSVHRLLIPDGRLCVVYDSMYNPMQLLSGLIHPGMLLTDPTHVHCWTQRRFRRLLQEHFQIVEERPGNILSLFLPFTNIFATARLYICVPKRP
jgi:2-polyprenyl-3-methyl-5-hydroxy-6-metoxy-1,4-benzoquinol methylase